MSKKQPSLTDKYLQYNKTSNPKDYDNLYKAILLFAYEIPIRLSKKNMFHCGDFVLYIEDKVKHLIDKFRYYGNPLEGYLFITFRAQFYTYIKEYNNSEQFIKRFNHYPNYKILDISNNIKENTITYNNPQKNNQNTLEKSISINDLIDVFQKTPFYKVFCKRLWLYVLKYSVYLDDTAIYNIAKKIKLPLSIAKKNLNSIKKYKEQQLNKKIIYEQNCNTKFSQHINRELMLAEQSILLSNQEKNTAIEKIKHSHKAYENKINRYNRLSFAISNEALAKSLNLPKGSIDTSIYHFKKLCIKHFEKQKKIHNSTFK